MNIHETEWGAKDMDEKIEPLKKGKVRHWPFTDVNEQSLRISEQLAARPNVWGVGLWPDEETERIAQKCAEVLANNFGLTAFSFVPEDSLINLIDIWGTDKEGLEWAITDMEDALGSTLADRAINLGGDVPFREVVMAIKEVIVYSVGSFKTKWPSIKINFWLSINSRKLSFDSYKSEICFRVMKNV